MVTEIRIYFEGHPNLREGFHEFLKDVRENARNRRYRFQLVAGRGQAVRDFMKALRLHREALNVLLLDSEQPDDGRLFEELSGRADWRPPAGAQVSSEQVFWMVQLMESWFLADPRTRSQFYGHGFRGNALPSNPQVEQVPKDDVLNGLKDATRATQKGAYSKTLHAPKVLRLLDPVRVVSAAPNCRRLFENLRQGLADRV